jgi:hypothetical protein
VSANSDSPQFEAAPKVGYCNPPQSTRFKKGQSGNPKGRPKGTLNVTTVLANTLRERVTIVEQGQRRTITKLEAAIKQLVNKAASGDLRAGRQLLELVRDAEAQQTVRAFPENRKIGELDKKVIYGILKRFELSNGDQEAKNNDADTR